MNISPTLASFLTLVRFSEGTSTSPLTKNDGYDVIVTGVDGPSVFTDYSDHPFANRPAVMVQPLSAKWPEGLFSTAAGGYQILYWIWVAYRKQLSLPDFSPSSQDAVAAQLISERHAIEPLLAGNIEEAITLCSGIWASLPGNSDGQGGHSMEALLDQWNTITGGASNA
jgi:muramidase (phage lysozyme)